MKKIIIVLCVIFLTGCDVEFNLIVDDSKNINEEIIVKVYDNEISSDFSSREEYGDYFANLYKDNSEYTGYSIDYKVENDGVRFYINRNYTSFIEYSSSILLKKFYNGLTVNDIGNYLTIQSTENLYAEQLDSDIIYSNESEIENIEFNFKFYNKVIENDADQVSNNTYTWNGLKDDGSFYFKLGPDLNYQVIISEFISNNFIPIISIGVVIVGILIFAVSIFIKIKRNDKI